VLLASTTRQRSLTAPLNAVITAQTVKTSQRAGFFVSRSRVSQFKISARSDARQNT
jgi:hypothetical protein